MALNLPMDVIILSLSVKINFVCFVTGLSYGNVNRNYCLLTLTIQEKPTRKTFLKFFIYYYYKHTKQNV